MLSCPIDHVRMSEWDSWQDGPPHDLFKRLRAECPIHWTDKISEWPDEDGYWSVTKAEDVHTVSKDCYVDATGAPGPAPETKM